MRPRAILWARVSDPRRRHSESANIHRGRLKQDTENQLIPLRAVAERLNWQVVEEIRAKGSAWNMDPAEKQRVLDRLRRGEADLVAVWDIDRWTRAEVYHALNEIVGLERHYGVRFYSINQPFLSTATIDPGLRQALIGLFAWIAEAESRKRSERVKAAVATKRARAGNLGLDPKWGKGKIASEEEVKRVKSLRAADPARWSVRALAKETGLSRSAVGRIVTPASARRGREVSQSTP